MAYDRDSRATQSALAQGAPGTALARPTPFRLRWLPKDTRREQRQAKRGRGDEQKESQNDQRVFG